MSRSLEIQELAIAITAKQYNPKLLTPDFLKYTGIVPNNWELARPPIVTDTVAQVIFQNGVNIVAQVNKIVFAELTATKESSEVEVGAIARKYVDKLPEIEYLAVGINFRGHVLFDGKNNTPRDYIFKTLLNPGPWHEFGQAPVQAAMRFIYTLDNTQLNLEINEAGLQMPDKTVVPAVLFSANFNHSLPQDSQSNKQTTLTQIINNWHSDQETFKEVVNNKFLNSGSYKFNLAPGFPVISSAETL
ncbi:MAG: hypothetical protein SAK29_39200 [Scytonema sp. PMC 1069.18]|nr:hypothetical protein [Scytonema sp. PMC 1069.18]MEC4882934.1 hypothetical protein [Scytonema sp. PMC 1070.18]